MATYKVPQDVEAEDKLLGPFSFRQFIYLLIAVGGGAFAFFLGRMFWPLALIPLPLVIFFLILSLPLRKDQPMEVYLAAILSFHLKPKQKIWQSDGIDRLVEFTNIVEEKDDISLKTLSSEQTIERISFLSDVIDTGGWAIRGVQNSSRLQDSVIEAGKTTDVHEDEQVLEAFDRMLDESDAKNRNNLLNNLRNTPNQNQPEQSQRLSPAYPVSINNPPQQATPSSNFSQNSNQTSVTPAPLDFEQFRQQPDAASQTPQPVSPSIPDPDIINLATNQDLSIETIASEAKRIKQKQQSKDLLGGQDQLEIKLR